MKRAQYGTKSYARRVLLSALRTWAKKRRAYHVALDRGGLDYIVSSGREREAIGELFGISRALRATGAWSERLEEMYDRRFARINNAKVTRRPFELRAAA